jgi:valyl-tRNA synthetase
VASWPEVDAARIDLAAEARMAALQEIVVKIRNLRTEAAIDPARRVEVVLHAVGAPAAVLEASELGLVGVLARASHVEVVTALDQVGAAVRGVASGFEVAIPLAAMLDVPAERTRLAREIERIATEVASRSRKLEDSAFLERAPAAVVERERGLRANLIEKQARLERSLAALGGAEPEP